MANAVPSNIGVIISKTTVCPQINGCRGLADIGQLFKPFASGMQNCYRQERLLLQTGQGGARSQHVCPDSAAPVASQHAMI
jgi:hypothetical protein